MCEITELLRAAESGDSRSTEELIPRVYNELRRLAAYLLSQERPGQTLQPTALVHEAYLRLVKSDDRHWENRRRFFSAAAQAMSRILVENARRKQRIKHGGGLQRVEVGHIELPAPLPGEELMALDEGLQRLEEMDGEAAELVRLRFFVGMTEKEAAELVGLSQRTAARTWAFAKAWLSHELYDEERAAD